MIIFYLYKFFSPSVNILEYIILTHICKFVKQSLCVRQRMLKKATKEHLQFSDMSFPHIWIRMQIQLCNKLQCIVKIKRTQGLCSLLPSPYPTHSCQTNPPKTPIFMCCFSKLASWLPLAWKIVSNAFIWQSRLSVMCTLANVTRCFFLRPRTSLVIWG